MLLSAAASGGIRAADAASPITHAAFIEAYVRCNNAAWTSPRKQVVPMDHPTMADRMRGITSPPVSGFVGENMYFDGIYGDVRPRDATTVGWAAATKAFADRGEVAKAAGSRAAALAVLARSGIRGAAALPDRAVEAIATELLLSSSDPKHLALTPIAPGTDLATPLTPAAARAMLTMIGGHFDVGRTTVAHPGAACPRDVLRALFR